MPKNPRFTTLKHCIFMGQYIKSVFDLPSSVSTWVKEVFGFITAHKKFSNNYWNKDIFGRHLDKSPVCKKEEPWDRTLWNSYLAAVRSYVCAICTILSISCVKIHAKRWFFLTRKWPVFKYIRHILMWPTMKSAI